MDYGKDTFDFHILRAFSVRMINMINMDLPSLFCAEQSKLIIQ